MSDDLELVAKEGRAPELMTLFTILPWSGDDLKHVSGDFFNRWVAATVRTFHGFGVGKAWGMKGAPAPENRHIAYADILFPFKGDEGFFKWYSGEGRENKCSDGDSSCGLTVRSLWLLMGARHALLNPPYRVGSVLEFLRAFAIVSGAFVGDPLKSLTYAASKEGGNILTEDEVEYWTAETPPMLTWEDFTPGPGDTIFINTPGQHVATVVEILERTQDCLTYISCDGGQRTLPGDAPCCSIQLMKRKAHLRSKVVQEKKDGKVTEVTRYWIEDEITTRKKRQVTGWSNVMLLPLPSKVITPFRNAGRKALPDPEPLGASNKNW